MATRRRIIYLITAFEAELSAYATVLQRHKGQDPPVLNTTQQLALPKASVCQEIEIQRALWLGLPRRAVATPCRASEPLPRFSPVLPWRSTLNPNGKSPFSGGRFARTFIEANDLYWPLLSGPLTSLWLIRAMTHFAVNPRDKKAAEKDISALGRAAQYLRMSAEYQEYSIANQSAAIALYAAAPSFDTVP
jgi:hypothetical protein